MIPLVKSLLVALAVALVRAVPAERVIAALFARIAAKPQSDQDREKALKTAEHLAELSALLTDTLCDGKATDSEIAQARDAAARMRLELLNTWAVGADSKDLQFRMSVIDPDKAYALPIPY